MVNNQRHSERLEVEVSRVGAYSSRVGAYSFSLLNLVKGFIERKQHSKLLITAGG
jgi:hypothetical protein